jgi:hypothetical protein
MGPSGALATSRPGGIAVIVDVLSRRRGDRG